MPITALAYCDIDKLHYVLAGQGNNLKVFIAYGRYSLVCQRDVFLDQTIHGIIEVNRENDNSIHFLIWGGVYYRYVQLKIDRDVMPEHKRRSLFIYSAHDIYITKCGLERSVSSAIIDVLPLQVKQWEGSQVKLVALTTHNDLIRLRNIEAVSGDDSLKSAPTLLAQGPKSVLYSGHLVYTEQDIIHVASGTVFGLIHLWAYEHASDNDEVLHSDRIRTLATLAGHQGSVFGVRILSPNHYDALQNQIIVASCSDDRSIRVWTVPDVYPEQLVISQDNQRHSLEHTGFTLADNSSEEGRIGSAIAVTMGHASRIWSLRFLIGELELPRILSVGEDGTSQVWQLLDSNSAATERGLPYTLRHEETRQHHSGKNIWAVACRDQDPSKVEIITGGADGQIVSYTLDTSISQTIWNIHEAVPEAIKLGMEQLQLWAPPPKPVSPIRELFQAMNGEWDLFRRINSRISTYPSGTFQGTARMTARSPTDESYDLEYLYEESGQLTTQQGFTMQGSRRYVYRYEQETDTISAWFVKPEAQSVVDYLFHKVTFEDSDRDIVRTVSAESEILLTASGHHLCIDDDYDADYRFRSQGNALQEWNIKYKVLGPTKDYTLDASFTRAEARLLQVFDSEVGPSPESSSSIAHDVSLVSSLHDRDGIKSYAWVNNGTLVAITARGCVLCGTLACRDYKGLEIEILWEFVNVKSELASYSIVKAWEGKSIAFIAGSRGAIYVYDPTSYLNPGWDREERLQEITRLPEAIDDLITASGSYVTKQVQMIATCKKSSSTFLMIFCLGDPSSSSTPPGSKLHHASTIELNLPDGFEVISACWIITLRMLVLGSRCGALAFHTSRSNTETLSYDEPSQSPLTYIRHVHGQDGITVIRDLDITYDYVHHTIFLITAGRDGRYALHKVSKGYKINTQYAVFGLGRTVTTREESAILFDTQHEGTAPFGPNIQGAHCDPFSSNVILWGFRSIDFVAWDMNCDKILTEVRCGGGHRNYAFVVPRKYNSAADFAWTKASALHFHRQSSNRYEVIQEGGHGREIKAVACCLGPGKRTKKKQYVATGAEDANIRIFEYSEEYRHRNLSSPFRKVGLIKKHTTGLQQLRWTDDGLILFSAGGCDELYAWRINQMKNWGIGTVQRAKCPVVSEDSDLRVMDIDVLKTNEARVEAAICQYMLSIVYSDSSVRIWTFLDAGKDSKFKLLCLGTYMACCLTQVRMLRDQEKQLHLLTAGTDGYLVSWPLPSDLGDRPNPKGVSNNPADFAAQSTIAWLTRHKVHQSSIKSLLAIDTAVGVLVVTGGDDNALAFTILPSPSPPAAPSFQTLLLPVAHSAAINGIEDITRRNRRWRKHDRRYFKIATCSNDQRLKYWDLVIDPRKSGVDALTIKKAGDHASMVADASSMAVLRREEVNLLCVAGIGVETWRIES
ncbi:hypothetical protein MMC25_007246 [Agyrium rufum]|nr:hypothetical protein [Agyrium rufum]